LVEKKLRSRFICGKNIAILVKRARLNHFSAAIMSPRVITADVTAAIIKPANPLTKLSIMKARMALIIEIRVIMTNGLPTPENG
jgi:hypothetical protein